MNTTPHRPDRPCNALPAQRWRQVRALKDVVALNEHVLEVLGVVAALRSPASPRIITEHAELWTSLDAASRHRAAQMPVLLLDLHFQDAEWWQAATRAAGDEVAEDRVLGRDAGSWQPEFIRQTLMIAWPSVREDRLAAGLLFGMSEAVANVVSALTPQQLDHISLYHSRELRLRWMHSNQFWRCLLSSAKANDMDALARTHLFGLQLLGGEVLRGGKPVRHVASVARWAESDQAHQRS